MLEVSALTSSNLLGYEVHMWDSFARPLLATVIYSLLGIVIFAVGYFIISGVTPFSLRKEIEEDQNTALAIVNRFGDSRPSNRDCCHYPRLT